MLRFQQYRRALGIYRGAAATPAVRGTPRKRHLRRPPLPLLPAWEALALQQLMRTASTSAMRFPPLPNDPPPSCFPAAAASPAPRAEGGNWGGEGAFDGFDAMDEATRR